jgi:ABC-type branched-subunit amino acid transport system permease subunit
VAQDEGALRLMGANPVRIKRWAFGIATATCAIAGALLIVSGRSTRTSIASTSAGPSAWSCWAAWAAWEGRWLPP